MCTCMCILAEGACALAKKGIAVLYLWMGWYNGCMRGVGGNCVSCTDRYDSNGVGHRRIYCNILINAKINTAVPFVFLGRKRTAVRSDIPKVWWGA